jgi:hypothetical protein
MKTAIRFAAALFAGALLTACSDSPTAPGASRIDAPTAAPSAALSGSGPITMRLDARVAQASDTTKTIAGMRVTFHNGVDSLDVHDNQTSDLDARWGHVSAKLRLGTGFKVRVSGGSPVWYRVPGYKTSHTLAGGVANFGTLPMAKSPYLVLNVVNALGGLPVSGSEFTVAASDGAGGWKPYMILSDEMDNFDGSPNQIGKLSYPFVHLGSLRLCENKVPSGFYALTPKCFTVDVPQTDKVYSKTVTYNPVLKVIPF